MTFSKLKSCVELYSELCILSRELIRADKLGTQPCKNCGMSRKDHINGDRCGFAVTDPKFSSADAEDTLLVEKSLELLEQLSALHGWGF